MSFPGLSNWPDRDEIKRAIDLITCNHVFELRVLFAERGGTVSGYFDATHHSEAIEAAEHWSGKAPGVYITLNPVDPILIARANNRAKTYAKETTSDTDILRRIWLPIDFDPVRPSGISSTDAEHALALERAEEFRSYQRERGWPESFSADSGNGAHEIYQIDLPNDAESLSLIQGFLASIADRFGDSKVKIDKTIGNAARIFRLYGTLNAKGDSTTERPHRLSKILQIPDRIELVSADLLRVAVPKQIPTGKLVLPRGPANFAPKDDFDLMASVGFDVRRWLESHNLPVIREKEWEKGGRLYIINPCPFNPAHDNQASIVGQFENGAIFFRCLHDGCKGKNWHDLRDQVEPGWREKRGSFGIRESVDDPHRLARIYLSQECYHSDGWTIRYFGGNWFRWDGVAYREIPHDELESSLNRAIKTEFDRYSMQSRTKPVEKETVSRKVTGNVVGNAIKALRSEVIVAASKGSPTWIDGEVTWEPEEVLPARNGLFHIPSLAEGNTTPLSSTPRFFSEFALDYDINPQAEPPHRWLNFLKQLWPDDPESISTLQEWMGYLLTPDTRLQKILMMIGPPRSGKSTIGRVMTAMIGKSNVAGPTLSSFRGEFGLQPLLGKSLAIISDARLRGQSDIVTERFLSISGEDTMTVNRKGIAAIDVNFKVRLVIISNETPTFDDASGALAHRMILLRLRHDFRGREDANLTDRLLIERSGILMWAVEGWKRLRERGYFIQPKSSTEFIEELNDLSSPVGAFVRERCVVGGPSLKVARHDLYQAYREWCQENGIIYHEKRETFGKLLHAAFPSIESSQPRIDGERVRYYTGIALNN